MCKKLLWYFLLFLPVYTSAQDVITKTNGEQINARVLEVWPSEIKYTVYHDSDSILYGIATNDIQHIRYEDGRTDSLKDATQLYSGNPFEQGDKDARKYYKGYRSAGTSTVVIGLLSPAAGLIPAIACSATPPANRSLGYPSAELMRNKDYASGYRFRARRIKQGKVWTNWGIAMGVNLGLGLLLLGAAR